MCVNAAVDVFLVVEWIGGQEKSGTDSGVFMRGNSFDMKVSSAESAVLCVCSHTSICTLYIVGFRSIIKAELYDFPGRMYYVVCR